MAASDQSWKDATSIYDFKADDIDGNEVSLEKYRGHVCLIVNVASKWGGTTKNYTQLQALYEKYSSAEGLRILAFPCNQFGGQEPGTNADIKEFVKKFNVTFDMFSKIDVNGDNAHPLWKYLKEKQHGTLGNFIKWNFSKFLVDKNGQPVKRYAPNVDPNAIEPDLLKYFEAWILSEAVDSLTVFSFTVRTAWKLACKPFVAGISWMYLIFTVEFNSEKSFECFNLVKDFF